ncbi:hypothetical protein WG29040_01290 [Pseudomonas sp. PAMC 29040]|uniref:hypothetical protein n=1 Tax=Pseudomonas sp. PAMC 29040 TaxID=2498450 RepID=UPI000FB65075|nr:hypothetical protein [Pseudomonas sp. PAMC 29040]RUT42262.1 hypothetical protein WG29040_01290 [Pseudomonas sp. PAMC 29040]
MKTPYWLIAACLALSLPAHAASIFKPVELKDNEMAELRGRFVMPGRIISFGIVMSSTWVSSKGDVVGATTSMQLQNTVKPQFYVSTYSAAGNGTLAAKGTGIVTGGAGLSTGQGVTQSVRAAGDNNSAYNNVDITISHAGQAPAVNQQGTLLTENNSVSVASGAGNLTVSASGGGIQMAIEANNNQGASLQQIAQGGVLQSTTLLGAGNAITNMTQLNVVMGANSQTTVASNCNINQLIGLRNLGY